MNIYHINWIQGGGYALNAVVIASSQESALTALHLDDSNDTEIQAFLIGACVDGTQKTRVVSHESL